MAIVWLDVASRFILAGDEFSKATAEYSIQTLQEALEKARQFNHNMIDTDFLLKIYSNSLIVNARIYATLWLEIGEKSKDAFIRNRTQQSL